MNMGFNGKTGTFWTSRLQASNSSPVEGVELRYPERSLFLDALYQLEGDRRLQSNYLDY